MKVNKLYMLTITALLISACAEDENQGAMSNEYITFSVNQNQTRAEADSPLASIKQQSYVPANNIFSQSSSSAGDVVYKPISCDYDEPLAMTVSSKPLDASPLTRGTENTTSTLKTNGAVFKVNAYPTGTLTNALLSAQSATYNSSDSKFHTTVSWGDVAASTAYDFYAWYPHTLPTGSSVSGKTITYSLGSLASSAMPDLLGASTTNTTYGSGTTKGTVDLTFKHLLVPVCFKLAAGYAGGTIKSIKFSSLVTAGTHDLSSADDATYGRTWTSTSTGEYTTQTLSTTGSSSATQVDGTEYFMMIPQTIASGTIITITTEKNSKTYTLQYQTSSAVVWKAGQVVTYTIGATAISSMSVYYPCAANSAQYSSGGYGWQSGSSYVDGPVSAWTTSDHFGLFAVNPTTGKIVISNLDVTASAGSSFTINTANYSDYFFSDQYTYYLYYPYQSGLTTTYTALAAGQSASASATADTFFADVIDNWTVATTQNTSALLKAQDLQIAKMNSSSFAMTHKMAIVDMTINTEGRLTSTQLYNYASVSFVGANNTSPLLLDDSSTLHAYSILTPRTLSGNFATITLDNLIKYYSYSQIIDNEKIYAFSVTRDVTLPVDYVARYNMASTTAFATSDSPNSSAYWNAANAVSNFTSKTLSSITCRNKTVSNWHLPSAEEWMSVIPTYYTKSEIATAGNSSIDVGGEENSIRFTFTNGDANHTPIVHYSGLYEVISWGKTSSGYEINHRKFYNEYYSPNTGSSNGGIAYGIRFKDSDGGKGQGYGLYTTAMRCEYRKDYPASGNYSLILRWKYLGPGNSTTMDNIIVESYWSSYDGEIIIPACGLLGSAKTSWPAGSYSSQSANTARGDYWAVTQFSDTYWTHMHFITGWAYSPRWENPLNCLTIRLFADVE